jgi:pimeloyl-ACP methyl ester carboxylesterase
MDIQLTEPGREQSRARYPDSSGYIKRDGVRLYYEVYGAGEPTIFLLPTWSIVHSRHWKMQIPYLARHCRVITFDGRGNGRSDRPPAGYAEAQFAADAMAVMDATATGRATLVSLSAGAQRALILAAENPDRVTGAVFIGPSVPLAVPPEDRGRYLLDAVMPTDEGWPRDQFAHFLRDYRGFLEFFFSQMSLSRTPPSRSRTASAGAWKPPPRLSSQRSPAMAWMRRRRASCVPGFAARCW